MTRSRTFKASPDGHPRSTARPGSWLAALDDGLSNPKLAWALLALALAARLAFVFVVPDRLQWSDAVQYEAVGRELSEKGTYGLQTLRAPGYPTLIAAVYKVFGPSLFALRVVEAVLSTVAAGLVGWLGFRMFGPRAGMLALGLAALHPMLAFLPSTQYSESTASLATVLILAAVFAALERGGLWRWALAGALIGVQTLIRPNAIALAPGLGIACLFLLRRGGRGWAAPALVAALAFAVTVTPWIARNHSVHGRWFFISTGGGRALWLGNNPNATNDTRLDYVIDAEAREAMRTLPPHEQDRYLFRRAIEYIREQPARAARHYVRKLGNIFALYPDPLTTHYVNPASRLSQGAASLVLFAGLLLALRHWRAEPRLWLLAGGALSFVLATALAFSNLRYRMLVEPALILMAGLGYARLWNGAGDRAGPAPAEPADPAREPR